MRILVIHTHYQYPGGEDSYFDSFLRLLAKYKYHYKLYEKDNNNLNGLVPKIKTSINLYSSFFQQEELTQIINQFNPDVAHFHNIYPQINPWAYKICKEAGIPVVQRIPGFRLICPNATMFREGKICTDCFDKFINYPAILHKCCYHSRFNSFLFGSALYLYKMLNLNKYVDKFIFQSNFSKDIYVKQFKLIEKNKAFILNHFVPNEYIPEKKTKKDYYIFVGRLSQEKGIIPLIKVFKKKINTKLVVVGTGPLHKVIEKLIMNSNNIKLLGYKNHKTTINLISQAKATIIPSLFYETGPFVLAESYAVNTPVIVPKRNDFAYQTINNKTGIFFEDLENDLPKIIDILDANYNALYYKTHIVNLFQKRFSEQIHIEKLSKLYINVHKKCHS